MPRVTINKCEFCGYELTGLSGRSCPECGYRIDGLIRRVCARKLAFAGFATGIASLPIIYVPAYLPRYPTHLLNDYFWYFAACSGVSIIALIRLLLLEYVPFHYKPYRGAFMCVICAVSAISSVVLYYKLILC